MERFKIVFLDIDGVLCTTNSINQSIADWCGIDVDDPNLFVKYKSITKDLGFFPSIDMDNWPFDRAALKNIHELARIPDVRFVISSTWRLGKTVNQLEELFAMKGMNIRIVGRTPSDHHTLHGRGEEIKYWSDSTATDNKNFEVSSFVIIDDDIFDIKKHFPNNIVETNFKDGFTNEHLKLAKDILNR